MASGCFRHLDEGKWIGRFARAHARAVRAGRGRRGQQRGVTSAPTATRTGSIANAARKAIDGEIDRTEAGSAELRMILAGDLPPEAGTQGSGGAHTTKQKAAQAYRTKRIVQGVKRAQQAAATLMSKWQAAAGKEIARRQEEESTRKWMGPIMGVWIGLGLGTPSAATLS